MAPCARPEDERGFTLVEVMVAIMILLVGVLGVVSMVEGANAVTSKTKAREGGTNVARSIIEVSRSIRYRDLTANAAGRRARKPPGPLRREAGSHGSHHQSRNVEYETTLTVCSLDDPRTVSARTRARWPTAPTRTYPASASTPTATRMTTSESA